jgi:hypothetical protein
MAESNHEPGVMPANGWRRNENGMKKIMAKITIVIGNVSMANGVMAASAA